MKNQYIFLFAFISILSLASCGDDDTAPDVVAPASYYFERDNVSTVSFSGQTTRIQMGQELISALGDTSTTELQLLEMFRNETAGGLDADPFESTDLNNSTKSIRSKVAASNDFFATNTTRSQRIKTTFETWIRAQITEIYAHQNQLAAAGQAGQIADGSKPRYVNAKGIEYNQVVNKSLIGALMVDQILNNYLSSSVLDEADNIQKNDEGVLAEGKMYTTMEHKWDEAYGYLFGNAADAASPLSSLGEDDSFLNKYVGRVEDDAHYAGIAQEIYDAFKLGRAAIVAKNYSVRDEQADILRKRISEVIAIRAIYYLQQGKSKLASVPAQYGSAFHDLSEGLGFVYALQFTRKVNSSEPYLTGTQVDQMLNDLYGSSTGFWSLDATTLDRISEDIADAFDGRI